MLGFGKRHRREDDDESREIGMFAPPEKFSSVDWLLAALIGAAAFFAIVAFSYKGLHPTAWDDCAFAAGQRPAATIMPGIWRVLVRSLFGALGVSGGCAAMALLGKVSFAVVVAFAYMSFKGMLSVLIRLIDGNSVWSKVLSRAVAALAAALFACSDPVWTVGQAFTSDAFTVLLVTFDVYLFVQFLCSGKVTPAYWAMFVMGIVCAETPLGMFMLVVFWGMFHILLRHGSLFHVKLLEPLKRQSSKWYLTLFWALGLLAGVTFAVVGFVKFDGLVYNGISLGDVPIRYASELWHMFIGAATPGAWIVGIGASMLPFIIAMVLLRRATDLEYFLSYHVGLVFFVIGCITYSQMASLQPLWFWTFGKSVQVQSPVLLFVCMLMTAATVCASLAVVLVDAYCRDHRKLAAQFDPDIDEEGGAKANKLVKPLVIVAVFAALFAGAAWGRRQPATMEMVATVDQYVKEVVDEADGAQWVFTDGTFDRAIELESARRGGSLKCLSLADVSSPQTRYLTAAAGMPDDEDKKSAEMGGANLLRTWHAKPARIERCAMMFGLEEWTERGGGEFPPISGTLARTKWPTAERREAGIKGGYGVIERIIRFYLDHGALAPEAGVYVNHVYLCMQGHMAYLAHKRAELFGRSTVDVSRAKQEHELADMLDNKNEARRKILDSMRNMKDHMLRQMTPREGLAYALSRAEFRLASYYAAPILDADPNDVNANFGMGMNYYNSHQYALAEKHMNICLNRNPRQPAFWNNLAVIQMHLGRFGEARMNARKALELLPDSAEIKKTLSQIDEAEKKAAEAEKKGDKKPAATGKDAPAKKAEKKAVEPPRPAPQKKAEPAKVNEKKAAEPPKAAQPRKDDVKKPANKPKKGEKPPKDGGKANKKEVAR